MAEDVLAYVLFDYEKEQKQIPQPSKPEQVVLEKNEFINYIVCDTIEYQRLNHNKAIKKTLTLPEWLNEMAIS